MNEDKPFFEPPLAASGDNESETGNFSDEFEVNIYISGGPFSFFTGPTKQVGFVTKLNRPPNSFSSELDS